MNTLWRNIESEVLGKRGKFALPKLLYWFLFGHGARRCILLYRLGKCLFDNGYRHASSFFFRALERNYGVYIHPKATIGSGFKLPHPTGVVIGLGAKIGDRVTIFQQVTLGGARLGDAKDNNYPQIGDDTVIFAGAKVIGPVYIGKQCTIGANAVVLTDVPDCFTAVGVPARCIMHDTPETDRIPE